MPLKKETFPGRDRFPFGKMLQMHLRIKQKNVLLIGQVMDKQDYNLCKHALINGETECNGEDLLTTECKDLSKALNIPCTSEGHHDKTTIKNVNWIKAKLEGKTRVKDSW